VVSTFRLEKVKLVTNVFIAENRPSFLLSNESFDNGSTMSFTYWTLLGWDTTF